MLFPTRDKPVQVRIFRQTAIFLGIMARRSAYYQLHLSCNAPIAIIISAENGLNAPQISFASIGVRKGWQARPGICVTGSLLRKATPKSEVPPVTSSIPTAHTPHAQGHPSLVPAMENSPSCRRRPRALSDLVLLRIQAALALSVRLEIDKSPNSSHKRGPS